MPMQPRRALLVIDVQQDYFSELGGNLPVEFPPATVTLANIGKAMDAAKSHGIPVVVVQHLAPPESPVFAENSAGAALHPAIAQRAYDHHITKKLPDAFCETDLAAWLQARAIDTVTVVGYMTQNCDLSTIISGMHQGWAMEFLSDGASSPPYANHAGRATAEEIHRVVCVTLQARFAAVMTTAQWIEAVASEAPPERGNIVASQRQALVEGLGIGPIS